MSDDIAIEVVNLSKSFKLPHERRNSVKSSLIGGLRKGKRTYEEQEVLKNISFKIKKGEFFGIVGRNGSGKSTLLKLLAGIYEPTQGTVTVNGSLTPFIELGVGFNPDLTGRENVFLNGALLGFNRSKVEEMYDGIVQFAELEKFMDQKLKNYSSGMQVRLAFSIAIRAQGDILLLDEVLAVGDEAFQRKCFDYFETLKRFKKTVVLVTHDMASVEKFCNKAMFIESGDIKKIGHPHDVAAAYSRSNDDKYQVSEIEEPKSDDDKYQKSHLSIILKNNKGETLKKFISGENMTVHLSWENNSVEHAGIAIFRQSGEYMFGANTYWDKYSLGATKQISYTVNLNLSEGSYFLQAGVFNKDITKHIDFEERGPMFAVSRNKDKPRWFGISNLEHSWSSINDIKGVK